MQLIIGVETNSKAGTDYQYIHSYINYYYQEKMGNVKLTPLFLSGKGNYKNKQAAIKNLKKQYGLNNQSVVIMCLDKDSKANSSNQDGLNTCIEEFCEKNNYCLVWFNRDIEDVFLNKQIKDKEKVGAALRFIEKNEICKIDNERFLSPEASSVHTSDLGLVLNKILG